jgi:hypothetical protein
LRSEDCDTPQPGNIQAGVLSDESGKGYQTMMNEALREYLVKSPRPLDEATLRRILCEELKTVG